jgi:hypothetical protein
MQKSVTLQEILPLIQHLSLMDKVRLMERLAPQIQRDLRLVVPSPRRSLRGLWSAVNVTSQDIAEARREMWSGFPREDI